MCNTNDGIGDLDVFNLRTSQVGGEPTFGRRLITAVVGVPILLWAAFVGGPWLTALLSLIGALGAWEMAHLSRAKGISTAPDAAIVTGLSLLMAAYIGTQADFPPAWPVAIFVSLMYALARHAGTQHDSPLLGSAAAIFSGLYAGGQLAALVLVRSISPAGREWLVLTLAVAWAVDTGAFAGGRLFGRRLLAPRISPKKTVEGAVSGWILAVAIAWILAISFGLEIGHALGVGALAGIVGQIGDLAESALKRDAGVKDSGRILPGHGGILDRFDSLLFIGPTVYVLLLLTGGA